MPKTGDGSGKATGGKMTGLASSLAGKTPSVSRVSSSVTNAAKNVKNTNPSGRTWTVGRFTITKAKDDRVGRNPDRGSVYRISDGQETASAYSLESAKKQAEYMNGVSREQRSSEADALKKKLGF